MNSIRHYVFALVGLIVLSLFTGARQSIWVAVVMAIFIATNNVPSLVARADEYHHSEWTGRLINVFTFSSMALGVAGGILLFVWYGWIAALGYIILILGYFALREDRYAKWERNVTTVRASLREIVGSSAEGRLTHDQMEKRFFLILEQDLIIEAYNLSFLAKLLLSEEGVPATEYQTYLRLFERYLSQTERHHLFSQLHRDVRVRLGLPAF